MRPIKTTPTRSCCPIFSGSSSFPLNRKTVLRAITLRSGASDKVPIRLSVRPSLRYSLLASAVAFTKGKTAIESIFLVRAADFEYSQYAVVTTAATISTAATLNIKGLRDRTGVGADVALETRTPESTVTAGGGAGCAADVRPESKSRFRRVSCELRSAALW